MASVIQLLERMSLVTDINDSNFNLLLEEQNISVEIKQAILTRDVDSLEKLLGSKQNLVCGIFPAEDDDDQGEDEDQDENDARQVKVA